MFQVRAWLSGLEGGSDELDGMIGGGGSMGGGIWFSDMEFLSEICRLNTPV
jgi:hypothetical protein